MEETMSCLLGRSMEIKGAPAKRSEDAKGGGCRLGPAKDYGRKTVGEKAMLLEGGKAASISLAGQAR